jgi:glycosyltransferase involved in cell wall biosynthesis
VNVAATQGAQAWREQWPITSRRGSLMPLPLVTVLMPTYNCRATLAEAIGCILAQTLDDFELIVVDDGSTDDSSSLIESIAANDPRVRMIRQENRGVGAALNAALDVARGKFLARMDADDRTIPERFAEQITFLDENPDITLVGGWHRTFGAIEGRVDQFPTEPGRVKAGLIFRNTISHPTVMMRRQAFQENGWRYTTDKTIPEDYFLWTLIAQRHKMANIPKVFLDYRIWPGSMCQKGWTELRDQCVVAQCRLLALAGLNADDPQRGVHYPLAFDEIPTDATFIAAAHQWLLEIWRHNDRSRFFDSAALARVLTGRYIALVRAAARCGKNIPGLADSLFRPYVQIPLQFAA